MFGRLSFIGVLQHAVLVAALEQAFKEQGVDLLFKLPLVPVVPSGFLFIELPRFLVLDAHQGAIVRPTQIGMKACCRFNARWALFWCQFSTQWVGSSAFRSCPILYPLGSQLQA